MGRGEDRKSKGKVERSRWKSVATTTAKNTGNEPEGKKALRIKGRLSTRHCEDANPLLG